MSLPAAYAWLDSVEPPRLVREALALYGVREKDGKIDNPVILAWADECGIKGYKDDEIPWCGLFMAVIAKRAGWPMVESPLWARNWAKWGNPSPEPGLGDVLVFVRGQGGHVGVYVGEDSDCFHVLGGNQGNAVSIVSIARDRLLAARRPAWKIAQPESVKPYTLAATGAVSTNEG